MAPVHIHAADLNVQRRGHAQVEDGVHQAAGLEIGADLRQFVLQPGAHAVHVLETAQLVPVVQSHLHKRGVRTGIRV